MQTGIFQSLTICIRELFPYEIKSCIPICVILHTGITVMHMGIPICKRAGIAKKFAYGDPRTHNEVVRIRGLTYTRRTAHCHSLSLICFCRVHLFCDTKLVMVMIRDCLMGIEQSSFIEDEDRDHHCIKSGIGICSVEVDETK